MEIRFSRLVVLATGILVSAVGSGTPVDYHYSNLSSLGGINSSAAAISNDGKIVGTASNLDGRDRAVIWTAATVTDLGVIGGGASQAFGVNMAGQIAGASTLRGNFDSQSATWAVGAGATKLAGLGGASGAALGINAAGMHVGYSETEYGSTHAVVWSNGAVSDLGTLGGWASFGYGINDAGVVVGAASVASEDIHAARWDGAAATDLGTLGGSYSWAYAINNVGQSVGYANTVGDTAMRATIWNGYNISELDTIGWSNSSAYSINSNGAVVGAAWNQVGSGHAVLWLDGSMVDLNKFLNIDLASAGWVLLQANDINDAGWIVGNAYNTTTGATSAFLLSAVPEPENSGMLFVGLLILGWVAHRRLKKERKF